MVTFRTLIALFLLLSASAPLFCPRKKGLNPATISPAKLISTDDSERTDDLPEPPSIFLYSKHSKISPEKRIRAALSPKYRRKNKLPLAKDILISMFCFTSKKIAKTVIQAAQAGANIIIIGDWNQAHHAYSKLSELACSSDNIKVYVVAKKTLHTKAMCVLYKNSSTCVLEGSYNYTESAKKHDETLDVHHAPSHYELQTQALMKLITDGTATLFDESKLADSKLKRAQRRAQAKKLADDAERDDDEDEENDDKESRESSAESSPEPFTAPSPSSDSMMSPTRKPKQKSAKPSPCSLPQELAIDTTPIPLLRAATLLAQRSLEATLIRHIQEAKFICLLMYTLSSESIADALVEAHGRGIEIVIIADRLQSAGQSSKIEWLRTNGITILRNTSDTLHCKCFIAKTIGDEYVVIDGSANVSSRVYDGHNIEHATRYVGADVFASYMGLYKKIAAKAVPLTVPMVTPLATAAAAPDLAVPPLALADSTNKQRKAESASKPIRRASKKHALDGSNAAPTAKKRLRA